MSCLNGVSLLVTQLEANPVAECCPGADSSCMLRRLLGTVTSVAIGRSHSLAVLGSGGGGGERVIRDGALQSWGSNAHGQLGSSNTAVDRISPGAAADMQSEMVVLVATGWFHSFAIAA